MIILHSHLQSQFKNELFYILHIFSTYRFLGCPVHQAWPHWVPPGETPQQGSVLNPLTTLHLLQSFPKLIFLVEEVAQFCQHFPR